MSTKKLSAEQRKTLLETLSARFEANRNRHAGITWASVMKRLEGNSEALWSLHEMERTGGEPDVVGRDTKTGGYLYVDCSAESPQGRRSLCYDRDALDSRKANKPASSALDMAREMGIEMLTEEQYQDLQNIGTFDLKTSSWIQTSSDVRNLGGALFCDRRFGRVFVYHNGAESYYAARGFRGLLKI